MWRSWGWASRWRRKGRHLGEATALYLQAKPGAKLFLLGTEMARELVSHGFSLVTKKENPDYVVLGFDTTLTYQKLWDACDLIRDGVEFIATHPDFNCPLEGGKYMPDAGAMAAFIQASTGRTPKVIGKPHREIVDAVLSRTQVPRERTAMVGDRLYTDIALAQDAGLTGILVLSGESGPRGLTVPYRPDYVFPSVASWALPCWQGRRGMDKRIWEIDLARAGHRPHGGLSPSMTCGNFSVWMSTTPAASGIGWAKPRPCSCSLFRNQQWSQHPNPQAGVVTVTMGMVYRRHLCGPGGYIRYGILHFLSCADCPLLQRLPPGVLAVLATAIGLSARHVDAARVGTGLLLPLGVRYPGFASADYYPLIPYLAVFLLGIIAYKLYYRRRRSLFPFALESPVIAALSRNSLKIYLLHQPIIVGLIMVYKHLYR